VCIAAGVAFVVAVMLAVPTRVASAASCPSDNSVVTSHSYERNGQSVNTLDGLDQGDTVAVHFTIASGCSAQVSLAAYQARSSALPQHLSTSAEGTFTAGTHTLQVVLPDCAYQVDFARGPVLTSVGPAGSGNFYGSRLIGSGAGGTDVCVESTGASSASTTSTTAAVDAVTATTLATEVSPETQLAASSTTTLAATGASTSIAGATALPRTGPDGRGLLLIAGLAFAVGATFVVAGGRRSPR
jgi:LPXTG-motif cell wall-anchored protein